MYGRTFQQISASGTNELKLQAASVHEFLAEFQSALLARARVVLTADPLNVTLTAGIGENGDRWNFSLMTRAVQQPTIQPGREHTIRHLDTDYHLRDYQTKIALFSIVRRSAVIDRCCGRNCTILVLPQPLCRILSKKLSAEGSLTRGQIEHMQCLMVDALTGTVPDEYSSAFMEMGSTLRFQ